MPVGNRQRLATLAAGELPVHQKRYGPRQRELDRAHELHDAGGGPYLRDGAPGEVGAGRGPAGSDIKGAYRWNIAYATISVLISCTLRLHCPRAPKSTLLSLPK